MEDLSVRPFAFQQRVEACRVLYFKYQGRHHEDIQREMRELGHERWNVRCLYARDQRGKHTPGWPERFGWYEELAKRELATDRTDKTDNRKDSEKVKRREGEKLRQPSHSLTNSPSHLPGCPNVPDPNAFIAWLKSISPEFKWDWKYQKYICDKLEKVRTGAIKRLMVFVPPRHGKSELVTVRFAAWCLKHRPKMNIILGSYNQKLANRFSRKIKNVYAADAAKVLSLESGVLSKEAMPRHDAAACQKCIEKASKCPNERSADTPVRMGDASSATNGREGYLAGGTGDADRSVRTPVRAPVRRINTDAEWETTEGGGVRAVGVGAGITGFGADLIIVDDPVKGRNEAESQTIRDNVSNWFNDDLYTRLEPDASIILIQTRWHEDDLAGRLLKEMREDPEAEQWEVIEFPAFAEPKPEPVAAAGASAGAFYDEFADYIPKPPKKQLYYILKGRRIPIHTIGGLRPEFQHEEEEEMQKPAREQGRNTQAGSQAPARVEGIALANARASATSPDSRPKTQDSRLPLWRDELGRRHGEVLCPERFPEKKLLQLKRKLGTYSFSALYQQRPTPSEGGFFKRHWFKVVDHAPHGLRWKRGYDLGLSANPGSDYTATARVAFDREGNLYIDRLFRKQMEYPEQRRAILALIRTEYDTEHIIEESANGTAVIQDLRRDPSLRSSQFRGIKVRESKTARAFAWNALAEEGRVYLVRGPWNKDFVQEACSFPTGFHDDQIDAVSIAVKAQNRPRRAFHAF